MTLTVAVLTIGDELLNGELADGNTAAIAAMLAARGYRLYESRTVGDTESDISEALQALSARREVVIVTGGLGPTADDLTARAAARAFERRLILNDEALAQIRDHFSRRGQTMHPRNEKQALLPQKVVVLPNDLGTAPGFLLRHRDRDVFFLPGVPAEMTAMLEKAVLPHLRRRSGGVFPGGERVLKIFGMVEPRVEEALLDAGLPSGVELAFGVDFPFVHAKLRAAGAQADELLDRAELAARQALGDVIVATGSETLAGNVVRLAAATDTTLAIAESCTGGLVAKLLTDIPGASAVLERAAVTYADTAKNDWLGVPFGVLETEGAVSSGCALAMARGMRRSAASDLALAITGIAGPGGGTLQKPVGTVFLALVGGDAERVERFCFSGDRRQVRRMAAVTALDWLRRHLGSRMELQHH